MIGPSHIDSIQTNIITEEIKSNSLFRNCTLDGIPGLANWSQYIQTILDKYKDQRLIWIVSDYKFNNFDYPVLKQLQEPTLFLDVTGHPGNVDRKFMTNEHISFLAAHTCKILDYIVTKYPNIKLIFWCLYKRTKGRDSSYPVEYQYDAMRTRYVDNTIDIDAYTTPEEFQTTLTRDEGGHPTREGYLVLSRMIEEAATSVTSP